MSPAIQHIPGWRCAPRTLSEANRRAEADRILRQVKAAKCPPLHDRKPAPRFIAPVAILCAVAALVLAVVVVVWGWRPIAVAAMLVACVMWLAREREMVEEKAETERADLDENERAIAG